MSQYKRKLKIGERWWYKFSFNNQTYFSKAIYLSKNEAKRAEGVKFEELSLNERNPSQKPVLSLLEAINERLDLLKAKKSKKYYKESKSYLSMLINHFGNVSLDVLTKADFNNLFNTLVDRLKENGQDNYKVNSMIRIYKAFYNQIINGYDLNIKNPLVGIKPFSIQKKLKYIPSDDDILKVKLICNRRQNLLIDFLLETGARINEALKVKGEDIFSDYVVLYTRKSKNSNLVL